MTPISTSPTGRSASLELTAPEVITSEILIVNLPARLQLYRSPDDSSFEPPVSTAILSRKSRFAWSRALPYNDSP